MCMHFMGVLIGFNKKTGMSNNTLRNWLKWGYVPEEAQYRIERITQGRLKTEWTSNNDRD